MGIHRRNQRRIQGSLAVALSLVLFGCVQNQEIELTAENTGKIEKTRVISVIVQEEVTAEVNQSRSAQAMGGGLLFALIDASVNSSRSKEMEKQIAPLKAALSDFDFREEFTERLKSATGEPSVLKITEVVASTTPYPEKKQMEVLESIPENALLTLSTDYKLSSDFRTLMITSTARLMIKGQSAPVYQETYTYKSPEIQSEDPEAALSKWMADGCAKFRKTSQDGIAEIISQLHKKLVKV